MAATDGQKNKLSKLIKSIAAYSSAEDRAHSAELRPTLKRRLAEVLDIVEAHEVEDERLSTLGRATDGSEREEESDGGDTAPPCWEPWMDFVPADTRLCFACIKATTSYVYAANEEAEIPDDWLEHCCVRATAMGISSMYVSLCNACRPNWDRLELDGAVKVDNEEVAVAYEDLNGKRLPETLIDLWYGENQRNQQKQWDQGHQRNDDDEAGGSPAESY